jgi:nicotinamidase-related amidase
LTLRSISHLIIVGVTADVCVKTTLHEANDRGYECLLVEDAIASYNAAFTDAVVAMARIGVTGSTTMSADLELKLQMLSGGDAP